MAKNIRANKKMGTRRFWIRNDNSWVFSQNVVEQPMMPNGAVIGHHIFLEICCFVIRQEGDLILDQFVGGGTTLVEAKLLNRNIIGVDINEIALERCEEKIDFIYESAKERLCCIKGDARNLDFIPNENIDFICTHPPYGYY